MSTQCYCIMHRFVILQSNPKCMDLFASWKAWITAYGISFVVSAGTVVVFNNFQPAQKDIAAKLIAESASFPGIPLPETEGKLLIYLDYTSKYSKYAGAFVFIGFMVAEAISIGCLFFILQRLEDKKTSFTRATYL
ncbi:unnamed protein product [Bursaphelenchus xylophilus]|uniref:(pine wood nematode) hypothetical protein n=1 Tax=Bursaphelenchus xylophilus TaxID=6326 RepID=A0A1I7RVL3_BURXY|nr:unnamed protein product [Bursaphelenchus xylophilus]CAG9081841.1 unnamed protein product [Bursaphelenchus xylophilus]